MNYLDSLYWIHERSKFGIKPGVKRMEWMLEQLNNPQHKIRGIHVGGTNGKGSTVAYLRTALIENDYSVGTFTSPFIESFNERISLNGVPIMNDELVQLVEQVKPVSEALEIETDLGGATEFEIITTMMFLYFGEINPVDFVIIEAGLGIKNDSTNVFKPVLSILTSIGLDHTDILGTTYLDIAKDKAAIIKPHIPIVYAVKNDDALKYVRDYALEQNAKPIELDREITVVSQDDEFTYRYKDYELETIILNMLGEHQKENAALAITALIELNESKGKPIHSMINKLNDIASKFYIADFEFPKALAKEEIAEELKLDNLHLIDDYVDFIENYEGDGLIITGSLYFISEVKAKINFN
ncbi:MAG: Mur ligase family protein [Staphylococcus epidermidis]|nr:Mur ligase family protein [Staphylococcus epidermidis]